MRNKIGYVIIGMLLGAIITSSIFLVQIREMKENREKKQIEKNEKILQQPNGEMMDPPEMGQDDKQKQPPERPDENKDTRNQTSEKKQNENVSKENEI